MYDLIKASKCQPFPLDVTESLNHFLIILQNIGLLPLPRLPLIWVAHPPEAELPLISDLRLGKPVGQAQCLGVFSTQAAGEDDLDGSFE